MASTDVSDVAGLAKIANSKLAQDIYADGLKKGATETGQLVGELAKTTRMVLQPLFTALQGASARVDRWVNEAINEVPPQRLTPAKPQLMRDVISFVASEDDRSEMRRFYVKLLASMMDRDLAESVHPAFTAVLHELSSLDAALLQICHADIPAGVRCGADDYLADALLQLSNMGNGRFTTVLLGVSATRMLRRLWQKSKGATKPEGDFSHHLGYLEYTIPLEGCSRDDVELAWSNLQRLRLVDSMDRSRWIWREDELAIKHVEKIMGCSWDAYGMYELTPFGVGFAKCCVPPSSWGTKWHAYEESPGSKKKTGDS